MTLSKRDQASIERRLVAALTDACETAKAELVGFCWLTHEIEYRDFPNSLRVTWVFDTQANQAQALSNGQSQRMTELTAIALKAIGIELGQLHRPVLVDSEEQCLKSHGGDWLKRLAQSNHGSRR
jgi:hypothetical protein